MSVHEETNHLKTVPVFNGKLIDTTIFLHKRCFYHDLVSENCGVGKKLWQTLKRILSQSNATVLPYFDDEKSLANRFGSFFIETIKKIRDTFKHIPSKNLHSDVELPIFSSF